MCVKPGQDGDVELDEGGYWNVVCLLVLVGVVVLVVRLV